MSWIPPVRGAYTLTAKFGERGAAWSSGMHTGMDFAAPLGTPVVAVDDGRVIYAQWGGSRYGFLIKVQHDGVQSWYAHLSGFNVRVLASVKAGQQIGRVGATGNATGPHVHLEARPGGGAPVDPSRYLTGKVAEPGDRIGVDDIPIIGGALEAARQVQEAVAFFTSPETWKRTALFIGGGLLLLLGLFLYSRQSVGDVVSTIGRKVMPS